MHPGARSSREIAVFRTSTGWINCVAFTPDGQSLITAGPHGDVELWTLGGEKLAELDGPRNPILCLAVSPDGKRIAGGYKGEAAFVCEARAESKFALFDAHTAAVHSVAFSPDGTLIASGDDDRTVHLWSADDRRPRHCFRCGGKTVASLLFSNDGARLFAGCSNGAIHDFDVDSGQEIRTLRRHGQQVGRLNWLPDGRLISATQYSGEGLLVHLVQLAQGRETTSLPAGIRADAAAQPWVAQVEISSDARSVLWITGNQNPNRLRVWDRRLGKVAYEVEEARCGAFSVEGTLVVGSSAGLMLVDYLNAVGLADFEVPELSAIHQIAISSTGRFIAAALTVGWPGEWVVRLWDRSTGEARDVPSGVVSIGRMRFSADERRLLVFGTPSEAAAGHDSRRRVAIAPVASDAPIATIDGTTDLDHLAGTPTDSTVICVSRAGETAFVNLASGQTLAVFPAMLDHIAALRDGLTWAGASGSHLRMLDLEQE